MLIEEAQDQAPDGSPGRSLLFPDLKRIHEAGRRLLGVINTLFADSIPEAERLEESHIHHEVRTPLNQIIGYTELLQEDAAGLDDQACIDDLAKIHTAARRLLDLVLANFGGKRFPVAAAERLDPGQPVGLLHKEPGRSRAPWPRTIPHDPNTLAVSSWPMMTVPTGRCSPAGSGGSATPSAWRKTGGRPWR